jgi:tetratricopeptide (TPR) repeat protein
MAIIADLVHGRLARVSNSPFESPSARRIKCSEARERGLTANGLRRLQILLDIRKYGIAWFLLLVGMAFTAAPRAAMPQEARPSASAGIVGTIVDTAGRPVAEATVVAEQDGHTGPVATKTNPSGVFEFSGLGAGSYRIKAEKSGQRTPAIAAVALQPGERRHVDLVLEAPGAVDSKSSAEAMSFADSPNFTVAGITDSTAAGGHGSDTAARTSETLARDTLALKSESDAQKPAGSPANTGEPSESESELRAALANKPGDFEVNHRLGEFYLQTGKYREAVNLLQASYQIDPGNRDNEYDLALAFKGSGDLLHAREHAQKLLGTKDSADLHRLLGELDEALGDPLAAVHQYDQAVRLDPREQNYFAWGSELLLHRAIEPALEVLRKGTGLYPNSARMLAALGAALFASGSYEEAAQRLCSASDLDPGDPDPYIFLGKVETAAPAPLACVEDRLSRFALQQPGNALANYYYAMSILKREDPIEDQQARQQVESLLAKALTVDPNLAGAYLQLGILSFGQRNYDKAIDDYKKAIAADSQLGLAHYRLGMAYERIGERAKAEEEFKLRNEADKVQAAAAERQRREVKQFLVVLKNQPAPPSAN